MSKPTWEMTLVELAKVYAEVKGVKHGRGGHLYYADGKHAGHGWEDFATRLKHRGILKVGVGVNWQRDHIPNSIRPKRTETTK